MMQPALALSDSGISTVSSLVMVDGTSPLSYLQGGGRGVWSDEATRLAAHSPSHSPDTERVDSVTLIGRRVLLAVEDVAKMRVALVAEDLDPAAVPAHADVALISRVEALVKGVPPTVLELCDA